MLWDAETGADLSTLEGHSKQLTSGSFSPDGKRIVTACEDATAKVWDAESGRKLLTLKGHAGPVNSASFSPDGAQIVTASEDTTMKVWNAETGAELRTINGHSRSVLSASFSPDGKRIVMTSLDVYLTSKIWDAETGNLLLTLKGHTGFVYSVSFSPDGRRIVTASRDKTAKLWDAETGADLLTLKGHTGSVNSGSFSPDGRRIITASADKTAKVWDAATGRELLTLKGHTGSVTSASFSPDGRRIITAGENNTAKLWDAESGSELLTLKGHTGPVTSASFSPDGTMIVTASQDKTAKLWDSRLLVEEFGRQKNLNLPQAIAYEGFDYGENEGELAGKSGGTGFDGAWSKGSLPTNPYHPWRYTRTGLSFGSLVTTGGAVRWTWSRRGINALGICDRRLEEPFHRGYGSFLFRLDNVPGSRSTAAVMFGGAYETDDSATVCVNTPEFVKTRAGLRLEGAEPNGVTQDLQGNPLVEGTTYMVLFKYSSNAQSKIAQAWILTDEQYDHFIRNNLTENELNTASLGTGAGNVLERCDTVRCEVASAAVNHLGLFGAFAGVDLTYDEIRLGKTLQDVLGDSSFNLNERQHPQGPLKHDLLPTVGDKLAAPPAIARFNSPQAKQHQQAWATHLGTTVEKEIMLGKDKLGKDVTLKMVLIPPGEFMMGTSDEVIQSLLQKAMGTNDEEWYRTHLPREKPQHKVILTHAVYMSKYELTRSQFRQFIKETGYLTEAEKSSAGGQGLLNNRWVNDRRFTWDNDFGTKQTESHPVVVVSWNDANEFCHWLSKKTESHFRLPTEAEWEFACRAGETRMFSFGDDPEEIPRYSWSLPTATTREPQQVGRLLPNRFGLHDMHGNVWEWCHDAYAAYGSQPSHINPQGPEIDTTDRRVMRGGSFNDSYRRLRSANRNIHSARSRFTNTGFRIVRAIESQKPE
jgi:WD40 repeat protein/formylglycine-generating enzyme required for sulfatase activity